MIKSKFNWDIQTSEQAISDDIITDYKLTPIITKILESKHITTREQIEMLINTSYKIGRAHV